MKTSVKLCGMTVACGVAFAAVILYVKSGGRISQGMQSSHAESIAEECFRNWTNQDAMLAVLAEVRGVDSGAARTARLQELVDASVSKSIQTGDPSARASLARDYLLWVIMPIAEALKTNGASESALSDYVIKAWGTFQALCSSFDEENPRQGSRRIAETARRDYEDGYRLFDRQWLALLFRDMPDGAEERFRAKWKAAFAEPDASGR